MKCIKLLSLSIALLMMFSLLAGCVEKPSADPTKDNVDKEKPQTATDTITQEVPSEKIVINSKEAFLATAAQFLDLSVYDALYVDEDSDSRYYSYDIGTNHRKNYDLDYTVTLGDGANFTMPVTIAELEQKGWHFDGDLTKEYEADFKGWTTLKNGSEKEMYVTICNLTGQATTVKDMVVTGINLDLYDEYEPTVKYEEAIDFTVCGSLSSASTLEDIFRRLGNPEVFGVTLKYDDKGNYAYSVIEIDYYQADSHYSNLQFSLSGDGNYILSIRYNIDPT